MTIPVPNLDDRTFTELVASSLNRIRATCPEWTDLGPADPGRALIETFAYLTEVLIYRVNRMPDVAYRQFLRMLGVAARPPGAASVQLAFTREEADAALTIPRGTTINVGESAVEDPPVFVTTAPVVFREGETEALGRAAHCTLVDGELLGIATGEGGASYEVAHAPIVQTGDPDDLVVAVEADAQELTGRLPAREYQGKGYRIWTEVESFVGTDHDDLVYQVDRSTGRIQFAPRLGGNGESLGAVPAEGREIRIWYRIGGGPDGNVAAGQLASFGGSQPGITVTNPTRATGGTAAETLDDLLARGPQQFHAGGRVVTARDYELRATAAPAVSRARAFTRRDIWRHAPEGQVEVVLVPQVSHEDQRPSLSLETLLSHQTDDALRSIRADLEERRPLGASCVVDWARYKKVSVRARIVVRDEEDRAGVKQRVLDRLHRTITPVPSGERLRPTDRVTQGGWQFGAPVRLSDVFDIILSEPGVTYADEIRFVVEEVPGSEVSSIRADGYQERTWYAASGSRLFRSMNNGAGWEVVGRFGPGRVSRVEPYPRASDARPAIPARPGLVAAVVDGVDDSAVHLSFDGGETWPITHRLAFPVNDIAWIVRAGVPTVLLATDRGLYEIAASSDGNFDQIRVDPADGTLGFYAVAAFGDVDGSIHVAVAGRDRSGVYLSSAAGRDGTFEHRPLDDDIRVLAAEFDGPSTFLWAGAAAVGEEGSGVHRLRIGEANGRWQAFNAGWVGGSCFDLAVSDRVAYAATHHGGVQRLDLSDGTWTMPQLASGLPLRGAERLFVPIRSVAFEDGLLLAGGDEGLVISDAVAAEFENASRTHHDEAVTIPETWLFVSGEHELEVVTQSETRTD